MIIIQTSTEIWEMYEGWVWGSWEEECERTIKCTNLLDGALSGQGQLEQDTACPSRLLLPRKPPLQLSQWLPAVLCWQFWRRNRVNKQLLNHNWRGWNYTFIFKDPHHTVSRSIQTLVRVSITVTGNTFSQKQADCVSIVAWSTFLQRDNIIRTFFCCCQVLHHRMNKMYKKHHVHSFPLFPPSPHSDANRHLYISRDVTIVKPYISPTLPVVTPWEPPTQDLSPNKNQTKKLRSAALQPLLN